LERPVVDRMVLGHDGEAFDGRVERRAPGHRPGEEHAVVLQAEVEMEACRAVSLDAEAAPVGQRFPRRGSGGAWRVAGAVTAGFRRAAEVAFAAVFLEGHLSPARQCWRSCRVMLNPLPPRPLSRLIWVTISPLGRASNGRPELGWEW